MRYLTLLLFLVLCSCQDLQKEEPITDSEKQIAKDLIQGVFDNIWSAADTTKLLKYHTPDFIILENGEVWDNDRIQQRNRRVLKRKHRPKRINKMNYISIEKYGESMQIAYWNDADFIEGDSLVNTLRWLESALAVKTEQGWKLKMMHSTRVQNK